ncbi:MAG TPA: hypothetical protein VF017_20875 [Thermoanaerobaculia bacterium]|nr:hypothetical protein [Thermoanaerobaculia bacterium]
MRGRILISTSLSLLVALALVPGAAAQRFPCGKLLLPYFEATLPEPGDNPFAGVSTLFAVSNYSEHTAAVVVTVWTNWGIPVLDFGVDLEAGAMRTVNLRDWLVFGVLPDRQLTDEELFHLQAALSGEQSPRDGLFYSSWVESRLATGYVTIEEPYCGVRMQDLWGDYALVDSSRAFAKMESLVRIGGPDNELCEAHLIRFLEGGESDIATHISVWTGLRGVPSATSEPAIGLMRSRCEFFDERGRRFDDRFLDLRATQDLLVADLLLAEEAGWAHCSTPGHYTYFVIEHQVPGLLGAAYPSFCATDLDASPPQRGPAIDLEKSVNGEDADSPPGPSFTPGTQLDWAFLVINVGDDPLESIEVTDDQGLAIDCPADQLDLGASMVCTATSVAGAPGEYRNLGRVTALGAEAALVEAFDPCHYRVFAAAIEIEKKVNGEDADQPPGPTLMAGSVVQWSYFVTNTGQARLTNVSVSDDQGVIVLCPKATLEVAETMICLGSGVAVAGHHRNVGTVTASPLAGPTVSASDPAHYFGSAAGIAIEKRVNGEDADVPPGPTLLAGSSVSWTYLVTNTGNVMLGEVSVTDDRGVVVTCPATVLDPAASMTCTGAGVALSGQYRNVGSVLGTPPVGAPVLASDPSHYFGIAPGVTIEKLVNGLDADTPPGPSLPVGSAVVWTYVVTNTGDVDLDDITVSDDHGVAVSCPATSLAVGVSMACTASGTAVAGAYVNIGTVSATPPTGEPVMASDPAHYQGVAVGNQGCTPGYWKNHTGSWPPTGYSPEQSVLSVFAESWRYPAQSAATLHQALGFGGGPGLAGAAEILLRAAVAGLLNAAHPDVAYPRLAEDVIDDTNTALASNSRDAMLTLAAALDADNNRGCPLN